MSTYFPEEKQEEEQSQSGTPGALLYTQLYVKNWPNTVYRNSVTPKKQNNPPHWSPNQVNNVSIHSATWQKKLVSPELHRLLVSMEVLFFQDVTHQYIKSLYMMTMWCSQNSS